MRRNVTSSSISRVAQLCAVLVWLAALPTASRAADPPADGERGQLMARTWCAHCHAVERGDTQQRADGVPSFVALANDPQQTPERLRAFLARPHGRMPDLNLSPRDRDDLIAYLHSLQQRR
jgi:mono/diheme cytochrome c family protein